MLYKFITRILEKTSWTIFNNVGVRLPARHFLGGTTPKAAPPPKRVNDRSAEVPGDAMWNQRWINGGHFANLRCHSGTLQGWLGSQYHVQICTFFFDYDYKIYQYHPIPIHLYHCNSSRVTSFDSADSAGHGLRGPWPQRPILRRMGVSVWTPNDPSLHLHFWRKSRSEIIVDHFLETKTICEQFLCMIATVRVTWSVFTQTQHQLLLFQARTCPFWT